MLHFCFHKLAAYAWQVIHDLMFEVFNKPGDTVWHCCVRCAIISRCSVRWSHLLPTFQSQKLSGLVALTTVTLSLLLAYCTDTDAARTPSLNVLPASRMTYGARLPALSACMCPPRRDAPVRPEFHGAPDGRQLQTAQPPPPMSHIDLLSTWRQCVVRRRWHQMCRARHAASCRRHIRHPTNYWCGTLYMGTRGRSVGRKCDRHRCVRMSGIAYCASLLPITYRQTGTLLNALIVG